MTDLHDLRLGVIGAGQRGVLAAAAHRPGRGARITALCDTDPATLENSARRFGVNGAAAVTDHRRLLCRTDVDAVIIATPDDTHAAIARDALTAGKTVYLEKPLAITIEDCDEVLRVAARTGTRLYLGHNMRHLGVVRVMRDIISRGEIGVPKTIWVRHFVGRGGDYYFKDWHADRRRTTGLLIQKAAHDIDVIHWLAGGYTRHVNAFGDLMLYGGLPRRPEGTPPADGWLTDWPWPPTASTGLHHRIDVEDVSVVNMRLDNGVIAAYQQCHFSPDYWRNYTVIGTHGRLENFGDEAGAVVKVWNRGPSAYRDDCDIAYTVPPAEGGHGGADEAVIDEFLRFARHGGPTDTSPVAARMSVAAGYLATLSLREGGTPRTVPPLEPGLLDYFARHQVSGRVARGR
ncbi:Gfo/Idh/MocA family protein [Planomonospora venezuelensis]|uniref:Putative dehydrogenase n=1 Tax=Planomonospora venezuelensis TaxID=1999 RepID=A0A841D528_PLAVE|nr:Gfo/Idh/MocA family oxidoreductase [Planomonospora venezuelensis]MBB5963527.1 putative dehydrogenase [Planomonospora venezuelensis]GIN02045.1 oxidoreductase [Planomonospora venezuelensis]